MKFANRFGASSLAEVGTIVCRRPLSAPRGRLDKTPAPLSGNHPSCELRLA